VLVQRVGLRGLLLIPGRIVVADELDPYETPNRRFDGHPGVIDKAVGRCKELKNLDTMDDGQGHLVFLDSEVGFWTRKATRGPTSYWKLPYSGISGFQVRRGPLGFWKLIIDGPPPPEGRTFHIRLGSLAAQNAAHILKAKGVQERPLN
jgi:hypothetical protein